MRRIVAPAGVALSALLELRMDKPYLINSILKLGQSVTHLCKLPGRNRRDLLLRLAEVAGFDVRQYTPHVIWQGCLS